MSPIAELYDGTELEFPDETKPEVIQQTVKRLTLQKRQASPGVDVAASRGGLSLEQQGAIPPADMNISAAPQQQKKGLMQYIGDEFRTGMKEATNPSTVNYLGAETLGSISPTARNIIGSFLGASRAAYAVPTGVAQKYVTEPLKEGAAPYTQEQLDYMKQFEPGRYQAISQMTPEEQTAGKQRAAEMAGTLASIGLTGGGTALVQKAPNVVLRTAGRVLDPLASAGGVNTQGRMLNAIEARKQNIADATGKVDTARSDLQGLLDQQAAKKAEQADFLNNINQSLETNKRLRPIMPEAPDVSGVNLADTVTQAAPTKMEAGEQFGKVVGGERKRLYGQSSKNYDKIIKDFGNEPIPPENINAAIQQSQALESDLRSTPATRTVGTVLEKGEAGDPVGDLFKYIQGSGSTRLGISPALGSKLDQLEKEGKLTNDTYRQLVAGTLSTGEGVNVGQVIRLRQVLRDASRRYGDSGNIAARSAVRSLEQPLDTALAGSSAANALKEADTFHRGISELVGPDSLSQKIFNLKPDQVVANVFLPAESGTRPNISMIRDAKKIYSTENPEAWRELTGSALKQLQSISGDINTGGLDPQKFHRNWVRYGETFKEALDPQQFSAVKAIDDTIAKYNMDTKTAMKAMRESQVQERGLKEAARDTRSKFGYDLGQLKEQIGTQRGTLKDLEKQLGATANAKYGKEVSPMTNPYFFMAIAQLGQAGQAMITGNIAAAGRQVAQGVVWYTLGNPYFLEKVVGSPNLSRALSIVSGTSKGVEVGSRNARYVRMLSDAVQEDMNQNQGQQ